jgi:hypothetical protein
MTAVNILSSYSFRRRISDLRLKNHPRLSSLLSGAAVEPRRGFHTEAVKWFNGDNHGPA